MSQYWFENKFSTVVGNCNVMYKHGLTQSIPKLTMILNMTPFQTQMSMPSASQHLYKQKINVRDKKDKIAPLSSMPWQNMGEWRYSATILGLEVSDELHIQDALFLRKEPQYLLEMMLGGPQSQSRHREELEPNYQCKCLCFKSM